MKGYLPFKNKIEGQSSSKGSVWGEISKGWNCSCRRPASPSTDRKSTRLNSSHLGISYAVFCLKKKKKRNNSIGAENMEADFRLVERKWKISESSTEVEHLIRHHVAMIVVLCLTALMITH